MHPKTRGLGHRDGGITGIIKMLFAFFLSFDFASFLVVDCMQRNPFNQSSTLTEAVLLPIPTPCLNTVGICRFTDSLSVGGLAIWTGDGGGDVIGFGIGADDKMREGEVIGGGDGNDEAAAEGVAEEGRDNRGGCGWCG